MCINLFTSPQAQFTVQIAKTTSLQSINCCLLRCPTYSFSAVIQCIGKKADKCALTYSQARRGNLTSKSGKTSLQSIVVFWDVLFVFRCYTIHLKESQEMCINLFTSPQGQFDVQIGKNFIIIHCCLLRCPTRFPLLYLTSEGSRDDINNLVRWRTLLKIH